ncbi:hypothetical protein [Pseudoalteromonas ulvae]|jgi:hypothetical protein|uniref:GNAT family N-acetyltransferase n=1 Tax=Pseudoalteromonas ulvae TaxID=107327 RepID=A0A244CKH0_PSEDV|nr:hypothetical protein [Pseudoalteromonas ulvae]OUL55865.1 hypothetical protein B1199_20875 [Pseudoalteromonas ulvae]
MPSNFIHESFIAPISLATDKFHLRVLEDSLAKLDFEAVMSSQKRLQGIFGLDSEWPKIDMSLEENVESLKIHRKEFVSRKAFAYSVFDHNKTKCLGSVYIDPSQSQHYDCEVYLWVRDDSLELDKELYYEVLKWLSNDWPFSKVAFPGRSISWSEWTEQLKVV